MSENESIKDTPIAAQVPEPPESPEPIPTAVIKRRRISTFWIVPVIALGVVGYLLWSQVMRDRGPMITIVFDNAAGLEPGSEIVYRGVAVGVVRDLSLSPGLQSVSVHAELRPDAGGLAVEGTEFWVVRPELSLQRISGLDTLVGPQYIALRPGDAGAKRVRSFVALDEPPRVEPPNADALRLTLRADRLGNLTAGSPVLYREVRVGEVRHAALSDDATGVLVTIDIEPRYAPLVYTNTKFWRSGGVGFDFGLFSGLSVEADSLDALLQASISFATPEREGKRGIRVESGASFELKDRADEDWLRWKPVVELGS